MNKRPFVTKEQLDRIIEQYPTPFHLYDEKGIRENVRRVREAFSWNPGYKEYFAVKATPNPFLLKLFHEEGCGCDCSSMTELVLSEACGITGHDVMFSSNVTTADEYRKAKAMDAIINLDDFTHIDFLEEEAGLPELVCLRYNPGGVFELSNGIMDNPGDSKYGFTKYQLLKGYSVLKMRGVKKFGLHAFLASNTATNDYYSDLAAVLFRLAVEIKQQCDVSLSFINLSGGVGIPYRPEQEPNDILKIGEGVRKRYEEILVPAGLGDIAIYTEMGRFMTGPYDGLVTKVIHQKHIYKEYLGCDACAADLMRPAMYGAYHHITVMGKEDQPNSRLYDVTGSLCENNDKFAVDRMLPYTEVGDILFIHDAGAHGHAMGYNYNGKVRHAELLYKEDGSVQLIRRSETIRDLFSTFDFCDVVKDADIPEGW